MSVTLQRIKDWSDRQFELARQKEAESDEPGLAPTDIEDPQFRDLAMGSIGVNGPDGRIALGQVGYQLANLKVAAEKFDADDSLHLDDDELDNMGHVYPSALRLAIFAKQGDAASKAPPRDSAVRAFFRKAMAAGRSVRTADVLQMTKGRRLTETQSEGLHWLMHLKPELFAQPDPPPTTGGTYYSGSGFLPHELYANPYSQYAEPYPSDAAASFLEGLVDLPTSPEQAAFEPVYDILGRDDLKLTSEDAHAIFGGAFGLSPEMIKDVFETHQSRHQGEIERLIQKHSGISLRSKDAKLSYYGNAWAQIFDATAMLVDAGFELCPPLRPEYANVMIDWGEKLPKGLKIPVTATITTETIDELDRDPQRMLATFDRDNDGFVTSEDINTRDQIYFSNWSGNNLSKVGQVGAWGVEHQMIRPRALKQIMDAMLGDFEAPPPDAEVMTAIPSSDPRHSALSGMPAAIIDGKALYEQNGSNGIRIQEQLDLDGKSKIQRPIYRSTSNGPHMLASFLYFKHDGKLMAAGPAGVSEFRGGDTWEPLVGVDSKIWSDNPCMRASLLNDNSGFKVGDQVFQLRTYSYQSKLSMTSINLATGEAGYVQTEFPTEANSGSEHAVIDGRAIVQFRDDPGIFSFNPSDGSWTALPEPPTPTKNAVIFERDGQLFVLGGQSPDGDLYWGRDLQRTLQIYDPKTEQWCEGPQLPHGIFSKSARFVRDEKTDSDYLVGHTSTLR